MLNHAEHELAGLLSAWSTAEERILHLFELDPTHVAAQPAERTGSAERLCAGITRSLTPFCLHADYAPAAVLLELDPTH